MLHSFSEFHLKDKKSDELEKYEKEYIERLNAKKPPKAEKKEKVRKKSTDKKLETKKSKKTKPPKKSIPKTKKPHKKKSKKYSESENDSGIVLIDDDLTVDKQIELEERKAYLEEARSQESID